MKVVYILIVLVLAALTLGCVGKKQAEISVSPTETPVSPAQTETPASTNDAFGTEAYINAIDSLVNDTSMDIPLSEATI